MAQEEFLEPAGQKAHEKVRRFSGAIRKAMPHTRWHSYKVTWAKGEHLSIQQELKASLLDQESLLKLTVPVDAIAYGVVGFAGWRRGNHIFHERVSAARI